MAQVTEMTVDPVQVSLSPASRWLTRAIAAVYLLLGLVMFAFQASLAWRREPGPG